MDDVIVTHVTLSDTAVAILITENIIRDNMEQLNKLLQQRRALDDRIAELRSSVDRNRQHMRALQHMVCQDDTYAPRC